MYVIHKLKPDRSVTGLIPVIIALTGGAILGIFFGSKVAFTFFAIFFWAFSLYTFTAFARTMNSGFVVAGLYQVFAGIVAFTFSPTRTGERSTITMFALLWTIFFLVWLIYLTITKKIKWRGREVLELAAAPIEETGNGYTARPLPAGKTEFTQHQIMEFAEFARRNLIAVSYVGKDRVIFVPVMMGRELPFIVGLKSDYINETWVAFDFDGNISVNISHRDYLEYRESLAFDKLCESLGNLFVEFIEMYQRREGVRIIDRMNAVGIGIFS
jgi:hypothetical protein